LAKFSRVPLTRSARATAASLAETMRRACMTSSSFHTWPAFMFMSRAGMPWATGLMGMSAPGGSCWTAMRAVRTLVTLAGGSGAGGDEVNRPGEAGQVGGLDGDIHGQAQLVATELAVRLGVDDPVGPQHLGDRSRVDRRVEVDGRHHVAAVALVGDERRGVV